MLARDAQNDDAILAALDRHDERRRHDVPTISVLVGPMLPSLRLFSEWAQTHDRPLVSARLEKADPEILVVPWFNELAKKSNLGAAAVQWLAGRLNRDSGWLERSLRLMTSHELGLFLESWLPLGTGTSVELVGRRLIECVATGTRPGGPDLAADLDLLLEGHGRPWLRVLTGVSEVVDRDYLPVLVMSLARSSVTGLERIARLLGELAAAQPRAALALLIEQEPLDRFIALAPASRAKALLLESIVTVTCKGLSDTAGPVSTSVGSRESTSDNLVAEDLESGIGDLESPRQESGDDDEARSAAERFLFERLESIAETAGLFELNGTLDFYFGLNRWIEVDLAARSLKLAIEVDGYHHFTDREAFRRDRRKDLELQKQGYLVVRVLAEDVVERLEDVTDTILAAVAFCRAVTTHAGATP